MILGYPRLWWPKIRDSNGRITWRTMLKVASFFLRILLIKMRLIGAKRLHKSEIGSALVLNKKTNLGVRDELIHIEEDNVIYKSVMLFGEWGKTEREFLASIVNSEVTLIDLGANIGLVTRQILKLSTNVRRVVVVEPRTESMLNLKKNLKTPSRDKNIEVTYCQFAIDRKNGTSNLYTDFGNIGNSSLKKTLTTNASQEAVLTITSELFYETYLFENETFILKSDLQGMDASVLNAFPQKFWDQVAGAVIEIWPSKYVEESDILELGRKLTNYFDCSFDSEHSRLIDGKTLIEYWSNTSLKALNLYVKRKA